MSVRVGVCSSTSYPSSVRHTQSYQQPSYHRHKTGSNSSADSERSCARIRTVLLYTQDHLSSQRQLLVNDSSHLGRSLVLPCLYYYYYQVRWVQDKIPIPSEALQLDFRNLAQIPAMHEHMEKCYDPRAILPLKCAYSDGLNSLASRKTTPSASLDKTALPPPRHTYPNTAS